MEDPLRGFAAAAGRRVAAFEGQLRIRRRQQRDVFHRVLDRRMTEVLTGNDFFTDIEYVGQDDVSAKKRVP